MTTKELRNKLLQMFPNEHRSQLQPIIDTLIKTAVSEGRQAGRVEAAAMIEVLVLGTGSVDHEALTDLMGTLRNE